MSSVEGFNPLRLAVSVLPASEKLHSDLELDAGIQSIDLATSANEGNLSRLVDHQASNLPGAPTRSNFTPLASFRQRYLDSSQEALSVVSIWGGEWSSSSSSSDELAKVVAIDELRMASLRRLRGRDGRNVFVGDSTFAAGSLTTAAKILANHMSSVLATSTSLCRTHNRWSLYFCRGSSNAAMTWSLQSDHLLLIWFLRRTLMETRSSESAGILSVTVAFGSMISTVSVTISQCSNSRFCQNATR